MSKLRKTPLYEEHKKLKARLVPFAGWEMPVQYSGVIQEHEAVRTKVGVFDVSHMGEFFISGKRAEEYLNRVTTNNVTKLEDGTCQYTLLCYENGTVVDDLILSRVSPTEYIAVVNAANLQKDLKWLMDQNKEGVEIIDRSDEFAMLAIQGPNSEKLVSKIYNSDFSSLKYYNFSQPEYHGAPSYVMRTGYTGESGFEVMVPVSKACELWQDVMTLGQEFGIQPVGLGARDTLRLEVAYSLYGHEISDQICPLEASLGWVIKLKKGDFIGREALQKVKDEGLKRKVVGFELTEPGIGRDGCDVYVGDQKIGYVTSGTFSPSLKKSIGLALIDISHVEIDKEIELDIRGRRKKAIIVKTPFYKKM